MNKTIVLSLAVAVLTGLCVVLAYQLWRANERPAVVQAPAPASEPSLPDGLAPEISQSRFPPASVEAAAIPASATAPTAPAEERSSRTVFWESDSFKRMVETHRRNLDNLPSWLKIPESAKDELAQLTVVQNQEVRFNEEKLDAETRAMKEQWETMKQYAPGRIEQLLGYPAYALWKEHQETATARSQLAVVNARPELSPLHDDAIRLIAAAMTSAARRAEEERQSKYGDMPDGPTTLETLAIRRETSLRADELMRETASAYLSGSQMKAFDAAQRQQQMLQERAWAAMRIQIETQNAAGKAGPGGG